MESFWILYWITRLDSILFTLAALTVFAAFAALFCGAAVAVSLEHDEVDAATAFKKWFVIFLVSAIALTCIRTLVPSKEDAMLIAAGVGITEAVKSDAAQRLASKSVAVVEKWLDEQTKDKEEKK